MSADNGIYILCTNDGYRVAHLMAIDNVSYDRDKNCDTRDFDVMIKNARVMWHSCKPLDDIEEAYREARKISKKLSDEGLWTEYGICEIHIPRNFEESPEKEVINNLYEVCRNCAHWKMLNSPIECHGSGDESCFSFTPDSPRTIPFWKKLSELIEMHQRHVETNLSPDDLADSICMYIGSLKDIARKMKG